MQLDIASPSIGNRYNTIRRLVCLDKVGKNATTYWWKIWTTERVGNINRRILKTVHGVRFHDDPDKVVYTYMLVNTMLMDKLHPGLHEFCKKWFKGPEGKVRKKEAKENERVDTRHVRRLPRTASGPVSRPVISGISAEEIARPEFWNERDLATKTVCTTCLSSRGRVKNDNIGESCEGFPDIGFVSRSCGLFLRSVGDTLRRLSSGTGPHARSGYFSTAIR